MEKTFIDLKKLKSKLDNNEICDADLLTLYSIIEKNVNKVKDATYISAFDWMATEPTINFVDTKLVYSMYAMWCNSKNMRPLTPNMMGRILNSSFGYKSQIFTVEGKSVRKYYKVN